MDMNIWEHVESYKNLQRLLSVMVARMLFSVNFDSVLMKPDIESMIRYLDKECWKTAYKWVKTTQSIPEDYTSLYLVVQTVPTLCHLVEIQGHSISIENDTDYIRLMYWYFRHLVKNSTWWVSDMIYEYRNMRRWNSPTDICNELMVYDDVYDDVLNAPNMIQKQIHWMVNTIQHVE